MGKKSGGRIKKDQRKNIVNPSQIATDFDRLIIDIAACDDWEMIDYYCDMLSYLEGLAKYRKATIESAGYGAFLGNNFKKRFDTKDKAHKYLIKKIVAIHDCDEDEINWEDYDDVGYCRSYWVGDKPYISLGDRLATIQSVNHDDETIHVFHFHKTPPDAPDWLDYQSPDEATQKLLGLIKENELLKSKRRDGAHAWNEIHRAKLFTGDNKELHEMLEDWLEHNKELLHPDGAK